MAISGSPPSSFAMRDHHDTASRAVLQSGLREASPTSSRQEPRLRDMCDEDLPFVVEEHLQHFPSGFFARLGAGFLRRYYRAFLTSPVAVTLTAEKSGRPVGYLVGVTSAGEHRAHVLREHGRALVLSGVARLLLRPRLAALFLRTRARRYLRKLRPGRTVSCRGAARVGVLAHVAVTPNLQDRGIGGQLVDTFEHDAARRGCDRLVLVTAADGSGAGRFYRRRGWRRADKHETPDGQPLETYELDLDGSREDGEGGRV